MTSLYRRGLLLSLAALSLTLPAKAAADWTPEQSRKYVGYLLLYDQRHRRQRGQCRSVRAGGRPGDDAGI